MFGGSPEAMEVGQVQEPREPGGHVGEGSLGVVPGGAAPQKQQTEGMALGESGWQGHSSPSKEDKGWPLTAAHCP